MALVRWNPAVDLANMSNELDRVFDEMMRGTGFAPRLDGHGQAAGFLPVDVSRRGSEVVVEASVPGFAPEEVAVTIEAGVLSITAEHSSETEEQNPGYVRRERFSGSLRRQLSLGKEVDGDRARASFANGVLTITMPLVEKAEPRRIAIESPGKTLEGKVSSGGKQSK